MAHFGPLYLEGRRVFFAFYWQILAAKKTRKYTFRLSLLKMCVGCELLFGQDSRFQPAGYVVKTLPLDRNTVWLHFAYFLLRATKSYANKCVPRSGHLTLFLYLFSGKSCCDYLKGFLWEENEIMYETVPLKICMDGIMIRLLLVIQGVCRTGQWWTWSTTVY